MARNTDPKLQNQVIYSIYVRSHTPEGTFRAILPDLDRIRALGVDLIWFMPIHPIGVQGKKGSLGCPYANRDYRSVNPAYGTMEDFRALVDAIHARGMKVLIDVVYNHTSPDSVLWNEHPEFFYKRPDGRPGNRVGEWTDVIDLDYGEPGLWDYQIETLRFWARIVDGFRCDVASLLPEPFWRMARASVAQVNPACIWLAETVHTGFGNLCRREGLGAARDVELFEAFDMEYEYDVRETFDGFLSGRLPLSAWTDALNFQEAIYPYNYNKLRFLENHDQPRIASLVPEAGRLEAFTALLYFLKGTTLLYAGQEFSAAHRPSLFEREPIDRSGRDLSPLLRRLAGIKRDCLAPDDWFFAAADDEKQIAVLQRGGARGRTVGAVPLGGQGGEVSAELPDGEYRELLEGGTVTVKNGKFACSDRPMIFTLPR